MLKSAPSGAIASRAPPSTSRHLLIDSSFQTPANPPPPSRSPDEWHTYANGDAQVDDARLFQKRREMEAAFEETRRNATPGPSAVPRSSATPASNAGPSNSGRLIETSPKQPAESVSGNTNLLVDLDVNAGYESYRPQQPRSSYASAAQSTKSADGGSEWSLLD